MSAFVLKCIALATMLIDHLGYIGQMNSSWEGFYIMRGIGRVAMPIYMFLIAQGCRRTRNAKKYLFTLLLFAFISEIPFDLIFQNAGPVYPGRPLTVFFWQSQNVMFTLFLGAASVIAFDKIKQTKAYMLCLLPLAVCAFLAIFMYTDYSWIGVVAIFILSLAKNKWQLFAAMAAVIILLRINSYSMLFVVFTGIALLLVMLYNGKRGPSFKWGFYLSYPVHLLLYGVGWIWWIGPYLYNIR